MEINRFKTSDADEIVTWFTSLEDYVLWGGRTFGWPLEASSIIERSQEPHVELYTFSASKSYSEPNADSNTNDLLGFMEFQRMSDNELRFCRVAIHPNQRGKGLGQSMLETALKAAKEIPNVTTITLAVFKQNHGAKRCYDKAGFEVVEKEPSVKEFNGKTWPLYQMELKIS
ncbi:GNAT family N-acetyltransferase [Vibrio crassostreae]|uniref:GNAT family N-acetyltransferase n=1 Tax=Vibrio crassostreae TaxID=246167 RepID=UPI0010497C51|nr:N-acetyltransferase [Vibrio crassostreae]TCN97535.1 RimJ/RimL family protein N-acetyltransferase [Vibrio crassostreae]CAK1739383.1 RimJ/RimL family protein N-acetyltransferase [Vibrio crassostreae]CAK1758872.1 RimJ/RimL family protein N-acetyltransferase [Vibrio crassostreae]CAK1762873.1 RimJ/RimL family protein N-acetyltransferase [Vibrio crassostreae]CAK2544066.1 RimJ/RimL family protein N-acetyltransferase [Vibrio crassostreae]